MSPFDPLIQQQNAGNQMWNPFSWAWRRRCTIISNAFANAIRLA